MPRDWDLKREFCDLYSLKIELTGVMVNEDMTDTSTEGLFIIYSMQREGSQLMLVKGICRAGIFGCSHPEGGTCS